MAQKKNPGSAGTLHGTGKHTPAVSGGACHQKKRPDIEAIRTHVARRWPMRRARRRRTQAAEQLKAHSPT